MKQLRWCAVCLERGAAPGGPEADTGLLGSRVHCHRKAACGAEHASGEAACAPRRVCCLRLAGDCLPICAKHSRISFEQTWGWVADLACGADSFVDHADGDTGAHPAVPGTCRLCGASTIQKSVSGTADLLILINLRRPAVCTPSDSTHCPLCSMSFDASIRAHQGRCRG